MKTLYINLTQKVISVRALIRGLCIKQDIPTDEELDALNNDPDYQEFERAMSETDLFSIPFIDPATTALFMTLNPDKSKVNYLTESYYRRKIRHTCRIMLKRGYTTFVVNAGTQYGMLAMEELLEMKKAGYGFQVYRSAIWAERRSLLHHLGYEALMSHACDKQFSIRIPAKYVKCVIRRVSAICAEQGIVFTDQRVPLECIKYYRRLDIRLNKDFHIRRLATALYKEFEGIK